MNAESKIPQENRQKTSNGPIFGMSILMGLTFIGGIVGVAVAMVGGMAIEAWVESSRPPGPRLSYGQMAGVIIIPLCGIIGAATGFACAVAWLRHPVIAVALMLTIAFFGWGFTSNLWSRQIETYGPDPSEAVLFYPPTAMCILTLVAAGLPVVIALVSRMPGFWSKAGQ